MNKGLLIETHLFEAKLQKEENGTYLVQGILQRAGAPNQNNRRYPKEILMRECQKYNQLIKERRALGELDHPDSPVINLKNVSHIVTKVWWEGDKIYGNLEILPTPSGNIVKNLLESNITIGVSSRGMGSLKQVGEIAEVQDDFSLLCWDIVSNPSNPNSWIKSSLNESVNSLTQFNQYSKVNSIITDILCASGNCPIF